MSVSSQTTNSPDVLNRSIDRFLIAAGWRVTEVTKRADGYDVTLTMAIDPDTTHVVTRHAHSAGEATLKACSSARAIMIREQQMAEAATT
jgi:hypothetical protein